MTTLAYYLLMPHTCACVAQSPVIVAKSPIRFAQSPFNELAQLHTGTRTYCTYTVYMSLCRVLVGVAQSSAIVA